MNPTDSPDHSSTDAPAPVPSPDAAASPAATAPANAPAAAASAPQTNASETGNGSTQPEHAAQGDAHHEAGASAGEGGAGGGGAAGVAGEGGATGAPGEGGAAGPAKKRRRRRRKGKGGPHVEGAAGESAGGEGHEGHEGEGASAEGGEAAAGEAGVEGGAGAPGAGRDKKQRPKKDQRPPREPRERPAFNVGDVVFGKIIEVSDDAIFVDLSGKGRGVFDKLELLLPEDQADEVEADARRAEAEAEAILADKPAGDGPVTEPAAGEALTPDGVVDAPTTLGEGQAAAEPMPAVAAEPAPEPAAEVAPAPKPAEPTRRVVVAPAVIEAAAAEAAAEAASTAEATPDAASDAEPVTQDESPRDTLTSGEAPAGETPAHVIQLPRVVLEPGAPFVGVVHNDGGRGGLVVLTHHPKRASRAKPAVAAALKNHTEVYGLVTGVIKGGVEVDVDGIRAFAPGSHMDIRLGTDLHPLVGKRLTFHVTQYGKRGRDVVLSRRAMLEKEAKAARESVLQKITPGEIVEGTVRSVVTFGAFIDVGGVEGLVPLTEMSHNRSDGPNDVFKAGEKTQVKIMRVDERGKVWLSKKATIADPWTEATKKYALGTKHAGTIVRLQPFGVFVELESGIDGLIHAADLSFKRFDHPSEIVKIGDKLDVVVASVDSGTHKIALHPAPEGAAANEEPQRVQLNKSVKVVVMIVEPGGLIVRILGASGRHARGYISGMATGTPRGTELRKLFPPGKELEAKVIEMDPRRGEVKLSLKAVQQDSERNAYQQYRQQVKREAKFGTFADLLAKKGTPQK
jgi:small subunit ribosomal protein S1